MLGLEKINNSKITIKDAEAFIASIAEESKSIALMKPTPENAELCAKEVTKHNKSIKGYTEQINALIGAWDEPLLKVLEPLQTALNDYMGACVDYQKSVLVAKKEAYKDKAKGSSVGIIGRLYTSKYTTKSGEQRVTCNISISQLKSYYNKEADETSIGGSNKISEPPYLGDEKEADPDHKNDLDEVEDDDLPF
jgi:hypothetical protein